MTVFMGFRQGSDVKEMEKLRRIATIKNLTEIVYNGNIDAIAVKK